MIVELFCESFFEVGVVSEAVEDGNGFKILLLVELMFEVIHDDLITFIDDDFHHFLHGGRETSHIFDIATCAAEYIDHENANEVL